MTYGGTIADKTRPEMVLFQSEKRKGKPHDARAGHMPSNLPNAKKTRYISKDVAAAICESFCA